MYTMILHFSKILYGILLSTSAYFKRYGGGGPRGRTGVQPSRGSWVQPEYKHTAKNNFNDVY